MKISPLALVLVGSLFSSAASHLLSLSPIANDSVAAPSQLTLSFSEGLEAGLSRVLVKTSFADTHQGACAGLPLRADGAAA